MNRQGREQFIIQMGREGFSLWVAQRLLSFGTTLHRYAEGQCNGDYPWDNGERKIATCPKCEMGYAKIQTRKGVCPDCALTARIERFCQEHGLTPTIQGDPRGAVLIVKGPSGREMVAG